MTTSIKARVTDIRPSYIVTMPEKQPLPEGMEENDSITFSNQCWKETQAVAMGDMVVLNDLKKMPKGWRAFQAKLFKDEKDREVKAEKPGIFARLMQAFA